MPIVPKNRTPAQPPVHRPDIQARARVRQVTPASSAEPALAAPPPARVAAASQPAEPAAQVLSYEVGYGKPPKDSQFKPGQSGNRKGRPKGARSLNTIVREKMTEKVVVRTAAGRKTVPRIEALVLKSMEGAFADSQRDRQRLFDWYGRAVPDDAILLPAGADSAAIALVPAPVIMPEQVVLDLAMLDELRSMLAAEQGGGS